MSMLLASRNSRSADRSRGAAEALALNAEGGAPDWVMLWPQGKFVVGRDKRSFVIHDPEAIIAATAPRLPLLIDYEHDYELRKPGDTTPAAGWVEQLEVRNGAIWGRVRWAERAANAIAGLEYRFISPVYLYRAGTDPMAVVALDGAGLTHRPNLDLVALNNQEVPMDKELLKALGLPETADLATAINAATALRTPSLDKYVPRADFDAAVTRAANAEARLAERDKAEAEVKALALVEGAIAAGKIAPASKEHFLELARNGREAVEKFLASAPAVLKPGADQDLKKGDPGGGSGGTALTDAQKAICRQLGIAEEDYAKAAA